MYFSIHCIFNPLYMSHLNIDRLMHRSKLIIGILSFVFLMAGIHAVAQTSATQTGAKDNMPYISPTPGEFPIMASSICVLGDLPTPQQVADYRACGFNLLVQDNKVELYDSLFSLFEGSGVKLFASAAPLRGPSHEACRDFMNKYKDNPILAGWEFRDEPRYAELGMLEGIYDVMVETDPEHLIRINLVGEMAKDFVGPDTPTMSAYLDTIQRRFAPEVWSYDYYPLKILDNNGILIVDYDNFYSNFEAFSKMAKITGRPFWAFCQSVGFRQGRIYKPVPKEEYLRFEAFSALAYGAQGLEYWTYRQCRNIPSADFEYLDGALTLDGKRTKVWNYIRNVNAEIKKYRNVFLGAELIDVVHTGPKRYRDTRQMPVSGFGPFIQVWNEGKGVLVSHLRNSGEDYYVVVSHDVEKRERISFDLRRGIKLQQVSGGKMMRGDGKRKSLTLQPGGYAIFKVVK